MNETERTLTIATVLLILSILSNFGWANIFFMTNMLTPPTEVTKEQGLAISFNGNIVMLALILEIVFYISTVLMLLFWPALSDFVRTHKIVVEEIPDGTTGNDPRTPPTQP